MGSVPVPKCPPPGMGGQGEVPTLGSRVRAGAAAPQGEIRHPPVAMSGAERGWDGLWGQDGDWAGCQLRAQRPCPYSRDSKRCLSSGDITFPPPRFVPKSIPVCTPPQSRGAGVAWQRGWGLGWALPGQGSGTRGGQATLRRCSALLTPPERFPQISRTCWNCRSSRFWRCRRIPARGSPPGSAVVMGRATGSAQAPQHATGCPHV